MNCCFLLFAHFIFCCFPRTWRLKPEIIQALLLVSNDISGNPWCKKKNMSLGVSLECYDLVAIVCSNVDLAATGSPPRFDDLTRMLNVDGWKTPGGVKFIPMEIGPVCLLVLTD